MNADNPELNRLENLHYCIAEVIKLDDQSFMQMNRANDAICLLQFSVQINLIQ